MSFSVDRAKSGVFNAYIFSELYKYGFIKSKSFTLSTCSADLQNKILHIVKSSVKHVIEDEGLTQYFHRVSFAGGVLSAHMNTTLLFGRDKVLGGKVHDIQLNATAGLGNAFSLSYYSNKLSYSLNGLYDAYNRRPTPRRAGEIPQPQESTVSKLNSIVNGIMSVPQSLRLVAEAIEYVNQIDSNYNFTFGDFRYVLNFCGIYRTRQPDLYSAKKVLDWMAVNHPEVLDQERLIAEGDLNEKVRRYIASYYQYNYYIDQEIMNFICNRINTRGTELGYTETPDAAPEAEW